VGWGEMSAAELRVRGREYTTAGWVTDTLEAMEYAYNLAAVVEVADQGVMRDLSQPLTVLRSSAASGIGTLNLALRLSIPEDAQLQVSSIQAAASFNIKFGGLGSAIKALASVFDPIARTERREQVRHTVAMNRLAEEDKMTKVASNRLDLLMKAFDSQSNFSKIAAEQLGEDGHGELKKLLAREYGRAVSILGENEIKVISPPKSE
jgi:hypothetical protein